MRIVFAGTPDFAVPALKALVAGGHDIAAVLTQPDRAAGRGRRVAASPAASCARALGLSLLQPASLDNGQAMTALRRLAPELMVVVAYGMILGRDVLALPARGCINVHASLLPRWRGAAPIQRAIDAGDGETGISIMQMEAGLDTGPVLARRATPILDRDTAGTLHDRLATLGAELLIETLKGVEAGLVEPETQDDSLATYAPKIAPEDARLDWRLPARQLERRVRAMNPWPVARARHAGQTLRIWAAQVVPAPAGASPGEVVRADRTGLDVACGEDALRLVTLQREGGRRMAAEAFLNGYPIEPGERFDS